MRNTRNIISMLLSWILHAFLADALFCALLGCYFGTETRVGVNINVKYGGWAPKGKQ